MSARERILSNFRKRIGSTPTEWQQRCNALKPFYEQSANGKRNMEIAIGHGLLEIVGVQKEGRQGIAVIKSDKAHAVNAILPEFDAPITPKQEDLIIWLDNEEGARVLQDQINIALLRMRGYVVKNAEIL